MLKRLLAIALFSAALLGGTQPTQATAPSVHRYETSADGQFVTETIEFQAPATVTLGFNYCNPLSCSGPDDPLRDCHAGFWIPTAGGEFPRTLSLPPLSGSTGTKLFLKTSSPAGVPSHYGYWEIGGTNPTGDFDTGVGIGAILANPPVSRPDGGVNLEFHSPLPSEVRSAFKPGGTCGVAEAVANQFRNLAVDNYYTTRFKVAVVWKLAKPGSIVNGQRTITVDSDDQTSPVQYGQNRPPAVPLETLQTTLMNAVSSHQPAGLTHQQLLDAFRQSGYRDDLVVDVRDVATRLGRGERAVAVVTITDPKTKARSVGVTVVSGYDAKRDRFTVVDPASGKTTSLRYDRLMAQNPQFNFVVKDTP